MTANILHTEQIAGQTVWVSLARPVVQDPETGRLLEGGFIAAFKIGEEPGMIDGEYLKEGAKLKFFPDHDTALRAALIAARARIQALHP